MTYDTGAIIREMDSIVLEYSKRFQDIGYSGLWRIGIKKSIIFGVGWQDERESSHQATLNIELMDPESGYISIRETLDAIISEHS